jgi:hypothetical protein
VIEWCGLRVDEGRMGDESMAVGVGTQGGQMVERELGGRDEVEGCFRNLGVRTLIFRCLIEIGFLGLEFRYWGRMRLDGGLYGDRR